MNGFSRRPVRVSAAAAAVLLGVLAGCGSAAPQLLDESAQAGLHAQVKSIRSALADPARAAAALDRFRAEVARLRDGGELAAADARVLLAQADQIERQVRAQAPPPRPTPAAAVAPPKDEGRPEGRDAGTDEGSRDAGGDEGKDEEKPGKGEGKGKKKGGGDG